MAIQNTLTCKITEGLENISINFEHQNQVFEHQNLGLSRGTALEKGSGTRNSSGNSDF